MRTPPETMAKCEGCGTVLDYEIGSVAWQCRDHDFCGYNKCERAHCRVGYFKGNTCKLGTKGCMLTHSEANHD